MKLHFLGSASSEGIPNPFCRCSLCQKAAQLKGKDLRTRSSMLIDNKLLIDLAPEFSYQIMRDGIDATAITHLLFTHTHADHFNVGELFSRMEGFGHNIDHPLTIIGNDKAIHGCSLQLPNYSQERFQLHCQPPFTTLKYADYTITPLLANHAPWEFCYLYFIEKNGINLFYGHDSGYFPEATWQWLSGKYIHGTILECTYGSNNNPHSEGHMSIETVLATQQRLQQIGCIDTRSKLFVSHISHNVNMTHQALSDFFAEKNITIAFDGLIATLD